MKYGIGALIGVAVAGVAVGAAGLAIIAHFVTKPKVA